MVDLTRFLTTDLMGIHLTDGGDGFKRSWIMLLPEGKFEHPRFGELDLTHKTLTEMVQNFKANARGIEIALDYDHKASDGDSRAPGWLEDMQVRPAKGDTPAGLWGLVRWTPLGLKDIQDQIYRYVSAEFKEDYKDDVSGEKYKNVIIGATLTNRPFMKQMPAVKLSEKQQQITLQNGKSVTVGRQLKLTECPDCGKDADAVTASGYWYRGMECPNCGHKFAEFQKPGQYTAKDRKKIADEDFAGPHQSFPIVTQQDVHDAARLIGHADDPAAVKAAVIRIAKRKGFSLPDAWAEEDSDTKAASEAAQEELPMATRSSRKLADDVEDAPADDEQEEILPEDDEEGEDASEDSSDESSDGDGEEEDEEEEDEPQEASTLSEMMEHITGRKTLAAPTAKKGRKALPKPSADDEEDAADGGDDEDTELDDAEEYDEASVSPVHIPGEMKIAKGKAKSAPKKMSESVILAEQVARLSEQLAERDETIKTLREAAFKTTVATRLSEMTKLIRTASEEADFALPRSFRQLYESFMFDEGVKLSENSLDRLNGLVAKALAVGTVPLTSLAGRIGSKEVVNLDDRRPRLTSKDPAKASEQRLAEAKAIALSEGVDYDALPDTGRLQFLARVRASGGNGEPVA